MNNLVKGCKITFDIKGLFNYFDNYKLELQSENVYNRSKALISKIYSRHH